MTSLFSGMRTEEIVFYIIIAIVIMLAIRDILCWYWKINEGIALLEKGIKKQDEIIKILMDRDKGRGV
ncbi:MAG: hypothetical protein ACD_2C00248G0003 [uncultured bacterium (gcode 4)]|uniref:Uncharacterized protein n=1 Tax=uncultured bacterium (gcode 4) TaxID=1234023 RepID=K2GZQ5_9BACT|nr:MAG: hypothetical protein ACD_2C00248G0003 [uncultured bacterium (gcode 4)]